MISIFDFLIFPFDFFRLIVLPVRSNPAAKNSTADADHGAAIFKSYFIISGHAHGNFSERVIFSEEDMLNTLKKDI